ncbi:hypothetical protein BpHYR1_012516, partial [Brachionus plicatilis]
KFCQQHKFKIKYWNIKFQFKFLPKIIFLIFDFLKNKEKVQQKLGDFKTNQRLMVYDEKKSRVYS